MRNALMVALVVLCGCKQPAVGKAPAEHVDEFNSGDWEVLTEALLVSGRNGDVDTFKGYVSEETQEMFEVSWKAITDKCDRGLAHGTITYEDRDKLLQIKEGCTWEALAKNYRPGRLITISPVEGGSYRVKEILPAGRKVDYLVGRGEGGWEITYEQDARWFRQLEAVAHAMVNGVLEKYGLSDKPAGTCGSGAPTEAETAGQTPGPESKGDAANAAR